MSEYLDRSQVIDLYEKYRPRLATCVYEFGQELRKLPIVEEIPHGDITPIEAFETTSRLIERIIELLPNIVDSVIANMPEAIDLYVKSKKETERRQINEGEKGREK